MCPRGPHGRVLRRDPADELSIPDGTHVAERDLVTTADAVVGGGATVEFGIRARNVAAGERATFGGGIEADGDCRLDVWTEVGGDVLVGGDAYVGERTTIDGRLMVAGDLDVGDDVEIAGGFDANGGIVVRNPMPTLVFYFVVLSGLLQFGEEAAADDLARALADGGDDDRDPLVIPRDATVSDGDWRVSTPATVGDDCRLHGNVRASGIDVGAGTELFGSLRADGDVRVGAGSRIHGDVTSEGGDVAVGEGAEVLGAVACEDLTLGDGAAVEGALRARGDVRRSAPAG